MIPLHIFQIAEKFGFVGVHPTSFCLTLIAFYRDCFSIPVFLFETLVSRCCFFIFGTRNTLCLKPFWLFHQLAHIFLRVFVCRSPHYVDLVQFTFPASKAHGPTKKNGITRIRNDFQHLNMQSKLENPTGFNTTIKHDQFFF